MATKTWTLYKNNAGQSVVFHILLVLILLCTSFNSFSHPFEFEIEKIEKLADAEKEANSNKNFEDCEVDELSFYLYANEKFALLNLMHIGEGFMLYFNLYRTKIPTPPPDFV